MAQEGLPAFTDDCVEKLDQQLRRSRTLASLQRAIVNVPFSNKLLTTSIDLGIVVFLQVNKKSKTIDRVALSDTELAKGAVSVSAKPFHDIRIPVNAKGNAIAGVIKTGKHKIVEDWRDLFTPVLTPEEARRNQMGASIECSLVWPLKAADGGALIFSFFQPIEYIDSEHLRFAECYATLVNKHLLRVAK